MFHSRFRLPIVLGLLVTYASTVFAGTSLASSKISPDLAAQPSNASVHVIVQYCNAPSPVETGLLGLLGGLVKLVLGTINAIVTDVLPGQLNLLAADPNVKYISLDRPVAARQAVTINAAEYTTEPINAPAVWQKGMSAPTLESH